MEKRKLIVNRGKVKISMQDILQSNISTCVCVCLYNPECKIGGMIHISRSRIIDTTPSGHLLQINEFYYADKAILQLLKLLKRNHSLIEDKALKLIIAGGLNNEGTIIETISELKKYDFKLIGKDINQNLNREIIFDIASEIIIINRHKPFYPDVTLEPKVFKL